MSAGAGCRARDRVQRPTVTPTEPDFGVSRRRPCAFFPRRAASRRSLPSSIRDANIFSHLPSRDVEERSLSDNGPRAFQRRGSRRLRMTDDTV